MTILDASTQLATAYAPTAVATNVNGTYYDAQKATNLGMGNTITWYTQVGTTATSGGAATVQFLLQGATDSAFTSPVTLAEATPAAEAYTVLVAGREYKIKVSRAPGSPTYEFYRVAVVIGTAVLTAGAFNSWLTIDDMQDNIAYPAGYTIVAG